MNPREKISACVTQWGTLALETHYLSHYSGFLWRPLHLNTCQRANEKSLYQKVTFHTKGNATAEPVQPLLALVKAKPMKSVALISKQTDILFG
jgi:hypothetical protein